MTKRETGLCTWCMRRTAIVPATGLIRGHVNEDKVNRCPGSRQTPVEGTVLPGMQKPTMNRGYLRRCQETRRTLAWMDLQVELATAARDAMLRAWGGRLSDLQEYEKALKAWKAVRASHDPRQKQGGFST